MESEERIFEAVPFALAEVLLREAGEMRWIARGVRMLPAIFPGEELILHRARLRDVGVGEVVLFVQDKKWYLQRVREILPGVRQPSLLTCEDAGAARKAPVFAEELLGRVSFVVRDGEQRVLPRGRSITQMVVSAAVNLMPGIARGCLAWRQLRSRIANLRHGAVDLAAEKLSGNT
jgi:hypothetical protein